MSLLDLALLMLRLGALSFGGGFSVIAEMQRELVDVHRVMTQQDFSTAFALGQATPGPGVLFLVPIGFRIAGVVGAIVAVVCFVGPPLAAQMWISGRWERLSRNRWVRATNRALVPISVGLTAAAAYGLALPLAGNLATLIAIAAGAAAALAFRLSPTVVVLVGAGLGLLGWV